MELKSHHEVTKNTKGHEEKRHEKIGDFAAIVLKVTVTVLENADAP